MLEFTAENTDVAPLTPTENPRAQLVSHYTLPAGASLWESFEVYLPTSFPIADVVNDPTGWLALECPVYGLPFGGSPPLGVGINDVGGVAEFDWDAGFYYVNPWANLWKSPVVLGQWIRFTWHYTVAQSGGTTLYMNDQLAATVAINALDPTDSTGPWTARLSLYYALNEFPQITGYFKGFRIATTQAAAEAG